MRGMKSVGVFAVCVLATASAEATCVNGAGVSRSAANMMARGIHRTCQIVEGNSYALAMPSNTLAESYLYRLQCVELGQGAAGVRYVQVGVAPLQFDPAPPAQSYCTIRSVKEVERFKTCSNPRLVEGELNLFASRDRLVANVSLGGEQGTFAHVAIGADTTFTYRNGLFTNRVVIANSGRHELQALASDGQGFHTLGGLNCRPE